MFAAGEAFDLPSVFCPAPSPTLSVVIPTLNECDNVSRLLARLHAVLEGLSWEAIFVDDGSTDGTRDIIADIARHDRRVRLISRIGRRGLSSAVVEGMLSSTASVVAVIDADLQHDESVLPQMVAAISKGRCDLAVGSRYVLGGSVGEWSWMRARVSRVATALAGLMIKTPLADPMSGFFAVRHDKVLLAAPYLSGRGYKILLDLIASSPKPLSISEFPYRFRPREAGKSKLTSLVALDYLRMLADKSLRQSRLIQVLPHVVVSAVNLAVLLAMVAVSRWPSGSPGTLLGSILETAVFTAPLSS